MDQTNLDIYGHPPLPWSRAEDQLKVEIGPNVTHFLATVRPDGRPHVAGVGALWVDGRFYFTSGAGTQKSRNLAKQPACVISVRLPDIDLVVEGTARKVSDEPTLQRLAHYFEVYMDALVEVGDRYVMGFDMELIADKMLDNFNRYRETGEKRSLDQARRYASLLRIDRQRLSSLFPPD